MPMRPSALEDRTLSIVEIGNRLREIREALLYTQTELSKRLSISLQTWNNYERGVSRIRIDEAYKVSRMTGATLDFIYMGRESTLPRALSEKLHHLRQLKSRNAA